MNHKKLRRLCAEERLSRRLGASGSRGLESGSLQDVQRAPLIYRHSLNFAAVAVYPCSEYHFY
jgi:hypothetical protein